MSILKASTFLIVVFFLGNNCIAQNKKVVKPVKKENNSLTTFLKDSNKDLLTNEAVQNQSKDKPVYKSMFLYYDKERLIVSPVKNGL